MGEALLDPRRRKFRVDVVYMSTMSFVPDVAPFEFCFAKNKIKTFIFEFINRIAVFTISKIIDIYFYLFYFFVFISFFFGWISQSDV